MYGCHIAPNTSVAGADQRSPRSENLAGNFRRGLQLVMACLVLGSGNVSAAPSFTDESDDLGGLYVGESFGSSWGDVNADGLPDLFVNRHRERPGLLVNQGDGTFENRAFEVTNWDTEAQFADMHGGSWGDFNNDGFSDLLISAGARDPSQFLVNNNGLLVDETANYTFDRTDWPGRQPIWYDFTKDGKLDFVMMQRGISQTFEQTATDFTKINFFTGQLCQDNQYGHLADFDFDDEIDWICVSTLFPQAAYDVTGIPYIDITSTLTQEPNPVDTVVVDLDGDLKNDIFMLRGRARVSGAELIDPLHAEAHLISEQGSQSSFSFEGGGDITIILHWSARNVQNVFIGAAGINPPFVSASEPITLTLSPTDPDNIGVAPHDPTIDRGIYIGFDTATNTWHIQNSSGPTTTFSYTYFYVDSTAAMTNLASQGLQAIDMPLDPLLFTSAGSTYTDTTATAGLDTPHACTGVVAADFDNDMDQDLYMVCRDAVSNTSNRYYENNGSGVFTEATGFGAEGPLGAGVGLAESVTVADYDVDGFVDLFVTNGLKLYPEVPFNAGGPDKLYRNQGNTNHWLLLDLEGTTSNRDGIGAVITVTAGGVTQRFEHNGGYHRWSQNSQRIHVGLAANTTADVVVTWPTGVVENFTALAADNVYNLLEGGSSSVVTIPTSVPQSACGLDGGGEPSVDFSEAVGVYLWRDCAEPTNWHFRASAGLVEPMAIQGTIVSTLDFGGVTELSIEMDDTLDYTTQASVIDFDLEIGVAGFDGFDFSFPAGADVCFQINSPAGQPALLGSYQNGKVGAFDLNTLGACSNVTPTIIPEAQAGVEGNAAGEILVPLRLSGISDSVITVDYVTQDGTAESSLDYVATTGTATFAAGTLTTTVAVTLLDDSLAEADETFELLLSNPSNALLAPLSTTATIVDDEPEACGPIAFDAATEAGVFISLNCNTDVWSVRVTSGGGGEAFTGKLSSDQILTSATGVSLETSDVFDTTDPMAVSFTLNVFGNGVDGFDFTLPMGAALCFDLDSPANSQTLLGAGRTALANPVDLNTQGVCTNTPAALSVQALSVAEDVAGGIATIDVTLSAPNSNIVTVDVATVDGSAIAGSDYQAVSQVLTFAVGVTLQSIDVPILNDSIAEGNEGFSLSLTNSVNADVDVQQGAIEILDDESSPCGPLSLNAATEQGVFLVKDCATDVWSLRVAQGGNGFDRFIGTIAADQAFGSLTPQFLEGNDIAVLTTATLVDYNLGVGGSGVDGLDFTVASDTGVCITVDSGPVVTVLLGSQKTVVASPFDLGTLGPCTNIIPTADISVVDVAENIAAGTMEFTVTLSEPSGTGTSVDYQTLNGTAAAPVDYAATSGTLNFAVGEVTKVISVGIVDDALGEVDEIFSVLLSNPVGLTFGVDIVAGTILDDEGVSTLAVVDVTVSEDDVAGSFDVSVTLSQASTSVVSATFTTVDGAALAGDDYVATTGVVQFQPGDLLQVVTVTLIDDGFAEGPELFELQLSNPVAAVLGDAAGDLLINDDEASPCGPQSIVSATDAGVFLAKNCGTNTWELRIPGGGNGFQQFSGSLLASADYTSVTGFGLEPNDVLTTVSPAEVTYTLGVGGTGIDGFDFDHPDGRDICVDLAPGSGTQVLVGTARTPVTVPFDLGTLGACTNLTPQLSISDVSVSETVAGAQVDVTVSLSMQSSNVVTVDYLTADITASAGLDYLSATNGLTFAVGETSKVISIALLDDMLAEGSETFSVTLSNQQNADLANSVATVTIADDEPSPCGPLNHVRGTDVGVFVGKDCTTGVWSVRVVEGGGAFIFYDGALTSDAALSGVVGVGLEAHDTLTNSPADTVTYSFGIGGSGEDGFDFVPAAGASMCLTLTSPTRSIYVGAARTELTGGSVDLLTLQACP